MKTGWWILLGVVLAGCGGTGGQVFNGGGATGGGGSGSGAGGGGGGGGGGGETGGGGGGSAGSADGSVPTNCTQDQDCAFGERCEMNLEFGVCVSRTPDAGPFGGGSGGGGFGGAGGGGSFVPDIDGGSQYPVDPGCNGATAPLEHPPKWPLLPPTAPADCATGFEMNNPYLYLHGKEHTLYARTAAGSRAVELEFDFATYQAPDGLTVTGTLQNGQQYVLFQTCRMRTADYYDPTDGQHRPPEDSIRDYRLVLRAGTVALRFDYGLATTPTYAKVKGLCDFFLTQPTPAPMTPPALAWWRSF